MRVQFPVSGKRIVSVFFGAAIACGLVSGCSPASVLTTEGAAGGLLGAAGGTGIGYAIGTQIGKTTENMLLAGTIGTGLGLMAGGLLYEQNMFSAERREVVIRRAQQISTQQKRIDSLREEMFERSSWGRQEVKSWNDRYWGDSYDSPYEGAVTR